MKLTKNQWIIIGVVVAIILVWYFFLRKKKESSFAISTSGETGIDCPCGTRSCTRRGQPGTCCKPCAESNYRMSRRGPTVSSSVVATMPSAITMPFKKPLDVSTLAAFKCPDGFVWTGPTSGCVHKDVLNPPTT